jgi:hypothetical protein
MALDRLATVELQLVTQHCDVQSLLALARCSRFTLTAASDSFAWRALSPLPLPFVARKSESRNSEIRVATKENLWQRLSSCIRPSPPLQSPPRPPPPLQLSERVSGSLLRFCDIAVQWRDANQHISLPATEAQLDQLAAIPRVRTLDTQARPDTSCAELESLLRRPGLSGLTALRCVEEQLDQSVARVMAECCPRLSTLSLSVVGRSGASEPLLHLLPALTDLTLCGTAYADHRAAAHADRFARLRRLTFLGTLPRDVHSTLTYPSMRALEHLSVSGLDVRFVDGHQRSPAEVDWNAAFANLPALRSLSVADSYAVDELLAVVTAHCAQLQSLDIRLTCLAAPVALGSAVPSVAALSAVLDRLAGVLVTLRMPSLQRYASGHPEGRCPSVDVWHRVHEELAGFAALQPRRAALELD